tara:strand:- start:28 stop:459 length:432 start_codon:yes stop_codon:yes gene_type:complete
MAELEKIRPHLRALKKVISSFDEIYGLDDDHVELLEYDASEKSSESESRCCKVKMLVECKEGVDPEDVVEGVKNSLSDLNVTEIKVGSLSGRLYSLRFSIQCWYPVLLLREYVEDGIGELEGMAVLESSSIVSLVRVTQKSMS